ncbi:MAG TPA: response regulator transcription factor [Solirubrobacteraceae bacterium]|nr:response regulator transcription factor [Solirubrobacteraceae bacterium]
MDDHEIVREGLRRALSNDPTIEVVGEAGTGAEALREARRNLPDVMLVDYRLPDTTGDELCRTIRGSFPSTQVVMLTTYLSEEVVRRSIEAGAAGFVTKASGLDELRDVLAKLAAGATAAFTGGASAIVQRLYEATAARAPKRPLTPQQERVLELAAHGLTYGEISGRLHISESTVRFHIQGLKERLDVRTKTELIAVAIRSALISPDTDSPVV